MAPSLDIIIVNWNAGGQLERCLDSILATSRNGFELLRVVVVDNASSDGSADQQLGKLPLTIIRNKVNRGFAAACNQGAFQSQASYLLFLNPDTALFPDSLEKPICYMEEEKHVRVGIVGLQLLSGPETVSRSCVRFPTVRGTVSAALGLVHLSRSLFPDHQMRDWDHSETREVDHVIGAFTLIRRTVFEQLGGYDERFFVYLEDLDLSLRMREAGFASVYLTSAKAFHQGGGCSDQAKASRLFYSLCSRLIYCYKHFSPVPAIGVAFVTVLIEPFSRFVYALTRGHFDEVRDTSKAYFLLWHRLFEALIKHEPPVPKNQATRDSADQSASRSANDATMETGSD